jgi:hypothetical protein
LARLLLIIIISTAMIFMLSQRGQEGKERRKSFVGGLGRL